MINNTFYTVIGIVFTALITFAIARFLVLPVGSFTDWLVGGAIFVWLVIVVTVPWDIYFQAKTVLEDAEVSRQRGLSLDNQQLNFAKQWVGRSLYIALGLHIFSAGVLYLLGLYSVGTIGYLGAAAALLLTLLRPIVAGYQYLAERLKQIGEQVRYPREDVVEVRSRLDTLASAVRRLEREFDRENEYAWVVQEEEFRKETRQALASIRTKLADLQAIHQQDIERVSREAQQAIAQITEDGQFLNHVREIIRFFKSA